MPLKFRKFFFFLILIIYICNVINSSGSIAIPINKSKTSNLFDLMTDPMLKTLVTTHNIPLQSWLVKDGTSRNVEGKLAGNHNPLHKGRDRRPRLYFWTQPLTAFTQFHPSKAKDASYSKHTFHEGAKFHHLCKDVISHILIRIKSYYQTCSYLGIISSNILFSFMLVHVC